MSDTNLVIIKGTLTRDAELTYTTKGTPLLTGSIANNRKSGDKEKVNFINFTIWGKLAESIAPYYLKGTQLVLQGEWEHQIWKDESGKNRHSDKLNVNDFSFAGGKRDSTKKPDSQSFENYEGM